MNSLDNFMHSTGHDLGIIINNIGFLERTLKDLNQTGKKQQEWIDGIRQAQKDICRKQDKFYKENIGKFKEND